MKPTIINLSGSARHGKGESCNIIERKLNAIDKKCLQINYADYLKFIHAMYLGGSKDKMFEHTPENRTGWQLLGTEKVRDKDPDFWVDTVIRLMNVIGDDFDYILISDCRFPNEYYRWIEEGYRIISIHSKRLNFDNGLTEEQKNHRSETSLKDFNFDIYLEAENLKQLENEIDTKLKFLFEE